MGWSMFVFLVKWVYRRRKMTCKFHQFVPILVLLGSIMPIDTSAHAGFHENMQRLDEEIAAHPKNAELYFKRGENYRNHSKWDLAEADYQQALAHTNAFPEVALAQGRMAFTRRLFKESDIYTASFLKAEAGDWRGLLLRARSHAAQDRFDAGIEDFEASIAANERPAPGHFLELARTRVSKGDVDAALDGLEAARKQIGHVPTLYLEGLNIAENAEMPERALAILDELETHIQTNPAWLVQRGKLLVSVEKNAQAEQAFRDAKDKISKLPARRRNVLAQKLLMKEIDERLTALEQSKSPLNTP